MIEWIVRKSGHGGFYAELIGKVEPGMLVGYKPGVFVGSTLYESVHFNTKKQAQAFIKRKTKHMGRYGAEELLDRKKEEKE